ncbi:KR domain-containing protein [Nonomuraea sp. K274]|uniref:KR domain-containing protein n=2 Tax=Nonomuraea cypriaca TaxID=1187855 RepID=A0A931A8S9_9ACTN|nr:KR domain-containing protein [Nonomuraea cypriaca]
MVVARWLAERGVRHLVLTGRTGAGRGHDADLEKLAGLGLQVTAVRADVTDEAAMTALFERFGRDLPPLREVYHLATSRGIGRLATTRVEDAHARLAAKLRGGWLLHQLCAGRGVSRLVFFSSTAACLGWRLGGHYAAANGFLDALAHERSRAGEQTLSVGWGAWGVSDSLDVDLVGDDGFRPMPPDDCLAILGSLLADDVTHCAVAAIDWPVLATAYRSGRPMPVLDSVAGPAQPVEYQRVASQPLASPPVAPQPVAPQLAGPQLAGPRSAGPQPVASRSAGPQPVGSPSAAAGEVGSRPEASEPVAARSVGAESMGVRPVGTQPVTTQPVTGPAGGSLGSIRDGAVPVTSSVPAAPAGKAGMAVGANDRVDSASGTSGADRWDQVDGVDGSSRADRWDWVDSANGISGGGSSGQVDGANGVREVDRGDRVGGVEGMRMMLRAELAAVLRIDDLEEIDPRVGLFELGLDSAMSVELRRRIEGRLNREVPPTLVFEYPTIEELAVALAGDSAGHYGRPGGVPEGAGPVVVPEGSGPGAEPHGHGALEEQDDLIRRLAEKLERLR